MLFDGAMSLLKSCASLTGEVYSHPLTLAVYSIQFILWLRDTQQDSTEKIACNPPWLQVIFIFQLPG